MTQPKSASSFFVYGALALIAVIAAAPLLMAAGSKDAPKPAAKMKPPTAEQKKNMAHATFAGGCFWSMEAIFKQLKGVYRAEPGYAGGTSPNPSYEKVGTGTTGYAESLDIDYDPKVISYSTLLKVLLTVHDPTTKDRQGADVGPQYRSIIFTRDDAQEKAAREVIAQFNKDKVYTNPIVTELVPFKKFYRAEDYHLNYYNLNPNQGYCRAVVKPKIDKFQHKFAAYLK